MAIKIIEKESAVSKPNTCPIPSRPTEKLLPKEGSHSACAYRLSFAEKQVSPSTAVVNVAREEINAHILAEAPFLRKNEMMPLNKGIVISKTGIIYRE